jgi:hypothetical protein
MVLSSFSICFSFGQLGCEVSDDYLFGVRGWLVSDSADVRQ